jgi:hypothetical protein
LQFFINQDVCFCLIEGGSESDAENGPLAKVIKMEKSCEARQSYMTENGETEIKQESESTESYRADSAVDNVREIKLALDDTYTFAFSVIFKEEHDSVEKEIIEEQGGIDHQINEVEDPPTNKVEDPPTNEGVDLNVGEMKYEVEEDDNLQVTTQFFIFCVLKRLYQGFGGKY